MSYTHTPHTTVKYPTCGRDSSHGNYAPKHPTSAGIYSEADRQRASEFVEVCSHCHTPLPMSGEAA